MWPGASPPVQLTSLLVPAQLAVLARQRPWGLQAQLLLQTPLAAFSQRGGPAPTEGLLLVPRKENTMFLSFCSKWGIGGGSRVINSLDLF